MINFIKKLVGAANTNTANLANNSQKADPKFNTPLANLQALRDQAWQNANKYRFDPTIGKLHADYLTDLNMLLAECGV